MFENMRGVEPVKFDDELEREGYRVYYCYDTNRMYEMLAPGGAYIGQRATKADARTAAYQHWKADQAMKKSAYPSHEEFGRRLSEYAAQGAISDTGLLRICAIVSRLTTWDIDEDKIVSAILIAFPWMTDEIKDVLAALQADPLLSIRKHGEDKEESDK